MRSPAYIEPPAIKKSAPLQVKSGEITHVSRSNFPDLLRAGDVVIANDAATLPASLSGIHSRTGATIEVRLAGRWSLEPKAVRYFSAIVFGEGNYRTPTEHRPSPPELRGGDELRLGSLRATVACLLDHPRLALLRFEGSFEEIWRGLVRQGKPIQYAHVPVMFKAAAAGIGNVLITRNRYPQLR